ncbi:MAG: hypothetical protein HY960_00720 [Ignavibacteriae bacterium]|nr:hypothetical protein [Ignavibacteriota bacterium]
MKSRIFYCLLALTLNFIPIFFHDVQGQQQISLEELSIGVEAGSSREVAYTNKQAGVFYTETNGNHRSAWQGWRIMSNEILDDYRLMIDDSPLLKSEASALVRPHQLVRTYPNGVKETVTLLDSVDALVIELEQINGDELLVRPFFSDFLTLEQCEASFEHNVLLIARKRQLTRTEKGNFPVWLGVATANPGLMNQSEIAQQSFSPMGIKTVISNQKSIIVFVAGDTKEQTVQLAHSVLKNYSERISSRKERMETLLNESFIQTSNKRFEIAMQWAKLSLDALIMNQVKKGIFAGLPWFDNYWGRDTYITLPGATLVNGNFSDAKEILKSFAAWQDTNKSSANYGRIPNLVTTNSIAYNTADGTPRFVMSLYDYFKYSLDAEFLREMYPVVKRSIEGTIKYHTDSMNFLTHGEAETWMDAVGPDGAWSPRGNRANDIQALWYKQLNVGFRLAEFMKDDSSMLKWGKFATKLQTNFIKYFYDSSSGMIYDHLKPNHKPDKQLRPNALFTYSMFPEKNNFVKPFRTITENLVFQHGIASLSPDDENFHPFHHYEPNYVPDAAYHNGIVWTWLAGAWIDLATEFGLSNLAFDVTSTMAKNLIERNAIGTIPELMDAAARPDEIEPRNSGTYSQAWSLAEFIRNCYQSYLGVYVNTNYFKTSDNISYLSKNPRILFAPRLPLALSKAEFKVTIGNQQIVVEYKKTKTQFELALTSPPDATPLQIEFIVPHDLVLDATPETLSLPIYRFTAPANKRTVFSIDERLVTLNQKRINQSGAIPALPPIRFTEIKLATPQVKSDLSSLKGPTHTMLRNSDIKRESNQANILFDASDPEGDDTGTSGFIYPQTPYLQAKSLDITRFTVSTDEKNVFFKLQFAILSNPGWHPEYGFQLTYVAIAIDKDNKLNSGQTVVGMNSNYVLENRNAFEQIIFVGGGIRLVDSKGKIIAEHIPVAGDEKNPLGNVLTKTIEFSLPIEQIGKASEQWQYTVLVGCQDDHGGAGIGEFRSVSSEAGEWIGGGKSNPNAPNVYDVIQPKK